MNDYKCMCLSIHISHSPPRFWDSHWIWAKRDYPWLPGKLSLTGPSPQPLQRSLLILLSSLLSSGIRKTWRYCQISLCKISSRTESTCLSMRNAASGAGKTTLFSKCIESFTEPLVALRVLSRLICSSSGMNSKTLVPWPTFLLFYCNGVSTSLRFSVHLPLCPTYWWYSPHVPHNTRVFLFLSKQCFLFQLKKHKWRLRQFSS